MPRRFSGIGMWNLIPNSASLLWKPLKKRAFKFFPKLGSTVKRTRGYSLVLTSYTVYTPFWRNWVANRRLPSRIAAKCGGITEAEKMQRVGLG